MSDEKIDTYRNIVELGEALKPGLDILDRIAKDSESFCASVRNQVEEEGITQNCIEHDFSQLKIDWERTFGLTHKNRFLTVEFEKCPICLESRNRDLAKSKWLAMGIPAKLVDCTFENFTVDDPNREDKLKALRRFKHQCEKETGFLIARGNLGSGKSHLSVASIRKLGSGIFVTNHDLIGALRQSYSDNSGPDALAEKYRSAKVLVLDELTEDVTGKDIPPLFYRILGYRYDHEKLTIITSNEEVPKILELLGPRLTDRVRENYQVVNFTWDSFRKRQI